MVSCMLDDRSSTIATSIPWETTSACPTDATGSMRAVARSKSDPVRSAAGSLRHREGRGSSKPRAPKFAAR